MTGPLLSRLLLSRLLLSRLLPRRLLLRRLLPPGAACLLLAASPAQQQVWERTAALLPAIHPASVAVELILLEGGLALPVAALALDDGRLLVTQLEGLVVVVEGGGVRPEPFLDLRHRVTGLEGEQGFFSVALEGEERSRARGRQRVLVAAFTEIGDGALVVAAYPVDGALQRADAAQERVLLRVPMPEPFHHGGMVAFGPDDLLWVSVGDGERAVGFLEGPPWTAQSLDELRGKLLRIDPLPQGLGGAAYAVPADNPLVGLERGAFGEQVREEIWAYGFRNPWKFSFAPDGALYLADVGQDRWEEINVVVPGGNYGWPSREGRECQSFPDRDELVDPGCPRAVSFEEPLVSYAHLHLDPRGGQAVVGGTVVTDPELEPLLGRYLFGDYVMGRIWSLDPAEGRIELLLDTELWVTAIERGPAGEVLVAAAQGPLFRLVLAD